MAMPEWVKRELRANFARASRAGRHAAGAEPRAARAVYGARDGALHIELTNGVWESLDLDLSVPALVSSVFQAPRVDGGVRPRRQGIIIQGQSGRGPQERSERFGTVRS
jgi:hypothetical protein